jgi:hypothetical protein
MSLTLSTPGADAALSNATSPSQPTHAFTAGAVFKGAFAGAAAGAAANVALYFAFSLAGVSLVALFAPGAPPVALGLGPVVMASLVPALPAALAALAVGRLAKSPARVYAIVAAVFALLSMGGPANLGGAGAGLKALLALMHVAAALGIAGGILRATKR